MSEWNSGAGGGGSASPGSGGVRGPRVVPMNVASQFADYLMRAQELGAFDQGDGALEVRAEVMEALRAFHEVLAGGRVEFNVVQRGHPDVVGELNRRATDAHAESNAINKAAGFYMCMTA